MGKFDNFKTGFFAGAAAGILLAGGLVHLTFNVLKIASIRLEGSDQATIGSPTTTTGDTSNASLDTEGTTSSSTSGQDNVTAQKQSQVSANEGDVVVGDQNRDVAVNGGTIKKTSAGGDVAVNGGDIKKTGVKSGIGSVSGENIRINITYKDNSELPGFDSGKGYSSEPPDIGQFNDAILISNVSFGERYFSTKTKEVFIKGKKYKSNFHLNPNQSEPTRVAFSLSGPSEVKGVLFQFGLQDWTSGSTTLTYLVKIAADGQPLWSGQVKYAERQIASVVLDVKGYSDVVFEYQVVEVGGADTRRNPIYFTDARLLFKGS